MQVLHLFNRRTKLVMAEPRGEYLPARSRGTDEFETTRTLHRVEDVVESASEGDDVRTEMWNYVAVWASERPRSDDRDEKNTRKRATAIVWETQP